MFFAPSHDRGMSCLPTPRSEGAGRLARRRRLGAAAAWLLQIDYSFSFRTSVTQCLCSFRNLDTPAEAGAWRLPPMENRACQNDEPGALPRRPAPVLSSTRRRNRLCRFFGRSLPCRPRRALPPGLCRRVLRRHGVVRVACWSTATQVRGLGVGD